MEQASGPPQPPQPPRPAPDDARPATREDLRSLRRWVVVAVVWAVAASAIGLIALLTDDDSSATDRRTTDLAGDLARFQRSLDRRIGSLEKQVGDLPTAGDVSKLENRLKRVEQRSSQTSADLKDTDRKLSDIDDRVKKLQSSSAGGTTGGGTTTSP